MTTIIAKMLDGRYARIIVPVPVMNVGPVVIDAGGHLVTFDGQHGAIWVEVVTVPGRIIVAKDAT